MKKYNLTMDDFVIQDGAGSNAGRRFLIIKNVDSALAVIKSDFIENGY